jgi:RNA ligase
VQRYKYPRTFHLPYSPKRGSDDKVLVSDAHFQGRQVVVTEKMDGENTTLYADYLHARSIEPEWDESKSWLDRLRLTFAPALPAGWRVCGENLFYKHTIHYQGLTSLFYVYSVWDAQNHCLSWAETTECCQSWGLQAMPLIYAGRYEAAAIRRAFDQYQQAAPQLVEGFVLRLAEAFDYESFGRSVAKYVAPTFEIAPGKHWKFAAKTMNTLINGRNAWEG